ncbi:endoglucanase [Salinimonas marina]|uniref:Glucanase n=1 Tax=Salinimonas marina TaxID=2785918 RepID=A0A7S9HD99_9ALTE|nr:glycosyl hydrolase family 8 [Salinimonas marina]QPG06081.1 endoglucanase [Salinimonas marina]
MRTCYIVVLVVAGMLLSACQELREPTAFENDWQQYVEQFYREGRIVDTGNDFVSHSEGQGYGMLFAVQAGDQKRFDAMWQWTRQTLQREDHLFSWRYRPCPQQSAACIDDTNNASDGDILIAWALLRASKMWEVEQYRVQALRIINSIEEQLLVNAHGYTVLLPGVEGFTRPGAVQLNLSYWVFPAFEAFYTLTDNPVWQDLIRSGHELLTRVASQPPSLPGDWMWLSEQELTVEGAVNQQYGFNACRIPLHLTWQKTSDPALLKPYLDFWKRYKVVPATVNLINGEIADYRWSEGMQAIAQVVYFRTGQQQEMPLLHPGPETDYFSASLIMLSQLNLAEGTL